MIPKMWTVLKCNSCVKKFVIVDKVDRFALVSVVSVVFVATYLLDLLFVGVLDRSLNDI